jgi:hypothetical protein
MPRNPNKLVALLLSLLLGLLPVQNLFASDSAPKAHERTAHMERAVDGQQRDRAASITCNGCDSGTCCKQNSCAFHHCAFCALSAIIPRESLVLGLATGMPVPGLGQRLPTNIHSDFFRPPRS